jgi:chemotaxis protein CheD
MSSQQATQIDPTAGKLQLRVGIGEMAFAFPDNVLVTTLGSCVSLCVYDRHEPIGAMAHIVLPQNNQRFKVDELSPKYADTAVKLLKNVLIKKGADEFDLAAKIAGGANMFSMIKSENMNIGVKNVEMTKLKLKEEHIRFAGEDTGGTKGRTVKFDVSSRMLTSGTISGIEKVI